jgi:hypothetical protein
LAAATAVYYNATTFELSYLTSSRTTKNTIEDLNTDTSVLYGLSPKTYIYNTDPEAGSQIGYIAQEVAALNKNFATYDVAGGDPTSINYDTIIVFLVEELKKLQKRVLQPTVIQPKVVANVYIVKPEDVCATIYLGASSEITAETIVTLPGTTAIGGFYIFVNQTNYTISIQNSNLTVVYVIPAKGTYGTTVKVVCYQSSPSSLFTITA